MHVLQFRTLNKWKVDIYTRWSTVIMFDRTAHAICNSEQMSRKQKSHCGIMEISCLRAGTEALTDHVQELVFLSLA